MQIETSTYLHFRQSLTEVSAINPLESMKAVVNPNMENIANQVAARLKSIIDRL